MTIKQLLKFTIIYGVGNAAIRAVTFLLIPLYTRNLSMENYGLLETCMTSMQVLEIVMGLGLIQSLVRYYKEYELRAEIATIFSTSFGLNFLAGIFLLLFLWVLRLPFSKLFFGGKVYLWILLMVGLISLPRSLNLLCISFYRAQNKAFTTSVLSLSVTVGIVISSIILVGFLKKGLAGALYSNLIVHTVATLGIGLFIFLKNKKLKFSYHVSKKILSFGFPLVFGMAGWFILYMANRYFLAYYSGFKEVAIYGLGYRVASVLEILVINSFQLAFGPYVFSQEGDPEIKPKISRIFTYLLPVLFFSTWAMALFSRDIIKILAPSAYSESFLAILLILPAIIFRGIYYWAASLLNLTNKTKIIGILLTGAAVMSIFLNRMLIPKYGWYGAALSTDLSIFLTTALTLIFGLKYYPIDFEKKRLIKITLQFVLQAAVLIITLQLPHFFYYLVNIMVFLFATIILYSSNFLLENEKRYLKRLVLKLTPGRPGSK
jgi:O-antigen/teichoic acid export membrane protein